MKKQHYKDLSENRSIRGPENTCVIVYLFGSQIEYSEGIWDDGTMSQSLGGHVFFSYQNPKHFSPVALFFRNSPTAPPCLVVPRALHRLCCAAAPPPPITVEAEGSTTQPPAPASAWVRPSLHLTPVCLRPPGGQGEAREWSGGFGPMDRRPPRAGVPKGHTRTPPGQRLGRWEAFPPQALAVSESPWEGGRGGAFQKKMQVGEPCEIVAQRSPSPSECMGGTGHPAPPGTAARGGPVPPG